MADYRPMQARQNGEGVGTTQSPRRRAPEAAGRSVKGDGAMDQRRVDTNAGASTSGRGARVTEEAITGFLEATLEKPVVPVKVYSEKELSREVEKLAGMLSSEKDWSSRMSTMQRLEGLLAGGAADYDSFPAMIRQLKEPLGTQLSDRRSAIIKQACHLLMMLARELQNNFEFGSEYFIPLLCKQVVITVQIMAESADNCIKTILFYCRPMKILPKLADMAMHDRGATMRTRCCEYCLLALERWQELPDIQRAADLFEELTKTCVRDALSEVRAIARQIFRSFSRLWPERGRRLLAALDPSARKALNEEELSATARRPTSPLTRSLSAFRYPSAPASTPHFQTAPARILAPAVQANQQLPPGTRAPPQDCSAQGPTTSHAISGATRVAATTPTVSGVSRVPGGYAERAAMQRRLAASLAKDPIPSNDVVDEERAPMPRPASTGSLGTAARRPNGGALRVELDSAYPPPPDPPKVASTSVTPRSNSSTSTSSYSRASTGPMQGVSSSAPRRVARLADMPVTAVGGLEAQGGAARRVPPQVSLPPRESGHSSRGPSSAASTPRSLAGDDEVYGWAGVDPPPLSDALAGGLSSGAEWTARVAAFAAVRRGLMEGGAEIVGCFKQVMRLYVEHLDDTHQKVAAAALSSLADLLSRPACRRALEAYLDRIMPPLFGRLVDPKENIRQLANKALEAISNAYSCDMLLPALLRSLDEQRSPKAKMAVLEYAIAALKKRGGGCIEGLSSTAGHLKQWLTRLTALTGDKDRKLKELAVTGIIAVHAHLDSPTVVSYILSLPGEDQSNLRRLLQQYTPAIEQDLIHTQFAKHQNRVTQSRVSDSSGPSRRTTNSTSSARESNGWRRSTDDVGYAADEETDEEPLESISRSGLRYDKEAYQERDVATPSLGGNNGTPRLGVDNGAPSLKEKEWEAVIAVQERLEEPLRGRASEGSLKELASTSGVTQKALASIKELSVHNNQQLWAQNSSDWVRVILASLGEGHERLREPALDALLSITKSQWEHITDVPTLVRAILPCASDRYQKIVNMAEECLFRIFGMLSKTTCFTLLDILLREQAGEPRRVVAKVLHKVALQLPIEELQHLLPIFFDGLAVAMTDKNAAARKEVTFCLVTLDEYVGEPFLEYLDTLSERHRKIVKIYADKRRDAAEEQALATEKH